MNEAMWQRTRMWYHYHVGRFKHYYQNPLCLRACQQQKLHQLLHNLSSQINFYHSFEGAKFNELPIVGKSVLHESFEKLNVFGFSHQQVLDTVKNDSLYIQQSVGTGGQPGLFLYTPQEMSIALGDLLSKLLPPIRLQPQKVAVFYFSSMPYIPIPVPSNRFTWCFFDLNQNFEELTLKLQTFSPQILVAPVQTLCALAALQAANEISIHPKKIVSTVEVMTPLEEKMIASTFLQNVHQLYQCAEGWLGVTCEFGTLHLNEDLFLIEKEWVDAEKTRFIPVITALTRYSQPLIRYRMEDILLLKSKPCLCGSPLLAVEKIVGRCEDVLYFPEKCNKQFLKPVFADSLYTAITQAGGGLQKYQIIQHSPYYLTLKIQANNQIIAQSSVEQQLIKLWENQSIRSPLLEFSPLEIAPLNEMFRQTKRLVSLPV